MKPSVRPILGVLMDPIERIRPYKDSTFAMLLEAKRRGYSLRYTTESGLGWHQGGAFAHWRELDVTDDRQNWHQLGAPVRSDLSDIDVLLLRKDPPVDESFLHELLWAQFPGGKRPIMVNDPAALLNCNEKLFALHFPELCPASMVSRTAADLKEFIADQGDVVLKPIDGMAGRSIFRVKAGDPNVNVILETLLDGGRRFALAQRYLPEITAGDKRILLIDGEPAPWCLARIPQGDDFRGNLARGGKGVAQPISDRDREIAAAVAPELRRLGLVFVGLDVIGSHLTEINVTSPTCIREIDEQAGTNLAGVLFDAIDKRLGR